MLLNFTAITADHSGAVTTLATFSAVGFALNLGLVTVVSVAITTMANKKKEDIMSSEPHRMVSAFLNRAYIVAYSIVTLLFMLGGLGVIAYLGTSMLWLLEGSAVVLFVSVLLTLGISGVLLFRSVYGSVKEFADTQKTKKYAKESLEEKKTLEALKEYPHCPSCDSVNTPKSKFCSDCGTAMDEAKPKGNKNNSKKKS